MELYQVLDRGQADGILIRTPNQQWVVIDAPRERTAAELGLAPPT